MQEIHEAFNARDLDRPPLLRPRVRDEDPGDRSYFDLAGMMVQLGLMPAPEGAEA